MNMYNTIIIICIIIVLVLYYYTKKHRYVPRMISQPSFSVHCVVARYNEDISWTKHLPNLFLYNKGKSLAHSIPLPNVGREGHTYYHHIITHYDQLPDYIVFLQGHPFDHSPNLFKTLERLFTRKPKRFSLLSETILSNDITDGTTWHWNLHSWWYKLPAIPKDLPMKIYHQLLKSKPNNNILYYGTGAQFMVSKQAIQRHPKSFYQRICDMLSYSSNPVEGFIMERLHAYILS